MKLKLIRLYKDSDTVLGNLFLDDIAQYCTVENAKKLIPCGTYLCKKYKSPKHGAVILLEDVPNRTWIEIHIANIAKETDGCIGIGKTFGYLAEEKAVLNSRTAMADLLSKVDGDLEIEVSEI